MGDEDQTTQPSLRDVETELCRLPDVVAARIVEDDGRPVEVHILAQTGKHPKQIARDIQSVALASFGLDIDRRIISVVQLGPDGNELPELEGGAERPRARITSIETQQGGLRATAKVGLALGDDEAVGFAEGSIASSAHGPLIAEATLDALRQLSPGAEALEFTTASSVRSAERDVAVVTLVHLDPPREQHLAGSAMVQRNYDDAVVRAVLDATNRRLAYLAPNNHDL